MRFASLPHLVPHAPVLGVLKGAVPIACICLLSPARPRPIADPAPPAPLGPAGRRSGGLLPATLLLWTTDAVHGIQPAWIGLAPACVCLLPRVGVLTGDEFAAGVDVRVCLSVAGILGSPRSSRGRGWGRCWGAPCSR